MLGDHLERPYNRLGRPLSRLFAHAADPRTPRSFPFRLRSSLLHEISPSTFALAGMWTENCLNLFSAAAKSHKPSHILTNGKGHDNLGNWEI